LVAAQIALAVVLLAAAGFLFQSISQATSGELGFSPDNVLLITVNPLLAARSSLPPSPHMTRYAAS
jgi:hypothetical protein